MAPGSFDVIWCEGAIYVIGFEPGLREWRRLLVPGGHIDVTEVCWTRPDTPPDCAAFWAKDTTIEDPPPAAQMPLIIVARDGGSRVMVVQLPKQLSVEQSKWDELVRAMARVLNPV